MTEIRYVALDSEQAALLEEVGVDLLREGDEERATKLLAIHLAWRYAKTQRFACDVDESGGLAELLDLHDFSKRVS